MAASISGVVFFDFDSDGVFQSGAGDALLDGRRVFIDANANGRFDSTTEASALTTADGSYSIGNLAAGDYRVVLARNAEWEQTTPVGPSTMWVSQYNSLYEYTRDGRLVRIFAVEAPPGGRSAYFAMKDVTVDRWGRVHVLQGDYQLAHISSFDPSTGIWEHHATPELLYAFSNDQNGEISTEGDYLYAGLQRYDLRDWTSTSRTLPPSRSLSDVRMGLNGKLYGWNSGSPRYLVYEFNPSTFVIEREFELKDENRFLIDMTGLAVDAAGDIFAADINGRTYHYSPAGSLLGFQKLHSSYPTDLDLSADGWLTSGNRFGNAGSMSVAFSPRVVFNVSDSLTFTAFTTYRGSGSSPLPHFVTLAANEVQGQLDFGFHTDGPLAIGEDYSLDEDATLTVAAADGVLKNDLGMLLTVARSVDVQHGTLTLLADGSFTYSPFDDFSGSDSFSYEVTDGAGRKDEGSVLLTIRSVNDAPTATDDAYNVNAFGSGYVFQVLNNDSTAPDTGETLEITEIGVPSHGGSAMIRAGAKAILYEPASGYSGEETFTYAVGDGQGGVDTATVVVQIIHSWHNVWRATDVDGDSHVAPRDVLLLINEINTSGSHLLGAPPTERVSWLDVDGDGYVSPRDALAVINEINEGSLPAPEGEADIAQSGGGWEGLLMLLADDFVMRRKR